MRQSLGFKDDEYINHMGFNTQFMMGFNTRKNLIALGIMVSIGGCALLSGCSTKNKKIQMPPHHVNILAVHAYDVPYQLDYPASISGVADFAVIPRVNGVIAAQLYKEGQAVHKNQVLYQIDPRPYENQLKSDQGQLEKDQEAAKEYKSILDRYNSLYKINAVSKQDVETASINYKNASGQMATDKANIANDKLNLEYCKVLSPADGVVAERVVTVGTMVSAYQTVLTYINTPNKLFVNFSVPENDRLDLQQGINNGTLIVPKNYKLAMNIGLANDQMLYNVGYVEFFDTRISLQNGTWNMRGNIDNDALPTKLLSGQFVHVYLNGAKFKHTFAIPQVAVFRDNTGAFVYTVDENNKIKKSPITTGVMSADQWVVTSGLHENDKVVVEGGMKVMAGDKVVIDNDQSKSNGNDGSNAANDKAKPTTNNSN